MLEQDLGGLQAWLFARVTAGVWGRQRLPEHREAGGIDAADVIRGSSALSADDRLDVYARSYVLRLAECLRAEFPVLRALIGEQVFDLFAGGYLSACPPSSPSLYDLGAGFPDHLEATRPQPHSGPGTLEALPASLARLERAISVSSRAPGPEVSNGAGGLDFTASLHDPSIRLRTPESLRLLRLDFDFTDALVSARAGRRPDPPPARETLVAVARSRYEVRVHRLDPLVFAWLEALRECDGRTHDAVRQASAAAGGEQDAVMGGLLASSLRGIDLGFLMPATEPA